MPPGKNAESNVYKVAVVPVNTSMLEACNMNRYCLGVLFAGAGFVLLEITSASLSTSI